MSITITSLLTTVFITSFIMFLQILFLRFFSLGQVITARLLMVLSIIFMVRLAMPFDYFFSNSIPSKKILPFITDMMSRTLFVVDQNSISLSNILLIVWGIGILYFSFDFFKQIGQVTKLKKVVDSNKLTSFGNYKIAFLDDVVSPFVLGLFNPTIILPKKGLSDKERQYIIAHESFHISSLDILIKYCYALLSIFYWWNPLIIFFKNHLSQIIELNADSHVIQELNDTEKIEYVETLIKISKNYSNSTKVNNNNATLAFSTKNDSYLLQRSKNILFTNRKKENPLKLFTLGFILLFLSSAFIFEPYSISETVENSTFEITNENSYLVKSNNSTYDLYSNNEFVLKITKEEKKKEFDSLDVYTKKEKNID